jgi:hypothetical protein
MLNSLFLIDIAPYKLIKKILTNGAIPDYLQPQIFVQYAAKNMRKKGGWLNVGGAGLSHVGNI